MIGSQWTDEGDDTDRLCCRTKRQDSPRVGCKSLNPNLHLAFFEPAFSNHVRFDEMWLSRVGY
jgi:hypothetical protein